MNILKICIYLWVYIYEIYHVYISVSVSVCAIHRSFEELLTMLGNKQGPFYHILSHPYSPLFHHDSCSQVTFRLYLLSISKVNIPFQLLPHSSSSAFSWNKLQYVFSFCSCVCLNTCLRWNHSINDGIYLPTVNLIFPDYQAHQ